MLTEKDYQKARRTPRLRESFVKEMEKYLEDKGKYIREVIYSKSEERDIFGIDTFVMYTELQGLIFRRSKIKITPDAFNQFVTFDEFKSALIDHEGQHAKDNFYRPNGIWSSLFDFLEPSTEMGFKFGIVIKESKKELRALKKQLERLSKRPNHSPDFSGWIQDCVERYEKRVGSMRGALGF